MGRPAIPIDVDDDTGVWSTDGLPMLYVPQHFFVNNHRAVEGRLGAEAMADMLFDPGYRSAWTWCEHESAQHQLSGDAVFRHYMQRLSQRGWGQFSVEHLDSSAGEARVRLDHSAFVAQYGTDHGRPVCYMFAGWLCGSVEWAAANQNRPITVQGREVACAAEADNDHCLFVVEPGDPT